MPRKELSFLLVGCVAVPSLGCNSATAPHIHRHIAAFSRRAEPRVGGRFREVSAHCLAGKTITYSGPSPPPQCRAAQGTQLTSYFYPRSSLRSRRPHGHAEKPPWHN